MAVAQVALTMEADQTEDETFAPKPDRGDASGFSPMDRLLDSFGEGSDAPIVIDPEDGLPRPEEGPLRTSEILPLSPRNLVCLGDESEYVELFLEDLGMGEDASYRSAIVRSSRGVSIAKERANASPKPLLPEGYDPYSKYENDGALRPRRIFSPNKVQERWGVRVGVDEDGNSLCFVKPRRERCKHLCVQLYPESGIDAGLGRVPLMHSPFCKAQVSMSGAFMDMSSAAMFACSLRSPPDPETEREILLWEEKKIQQGAERQDVPFILPSAGKGPPPPSWPEDTTILGSRMFCVTDPRHGSSHVGTINIQPPSGLSAEVLSKATELVIVGNDWPVNREMMRDMGLGENAGYHVVQLSSAYFLDEGSHTPEYLDMWPSQYDGLFEFSIKALPKYIADRLEGGPEAAHVIVTSADPEWVTFFLRHLAKHLSRNTLIVPGELKRPEFIHHVAIHAKKEKA